MRKSSLPLPHSSGETVPTHFYYLDYRLSQTWARYAGVSAYQWILEQENTTLPQHGETQDSAGPEL